MQWLTLKFIITVPYLSREGIYSEHFFSTMISKIILQLYLVISKCFYGYADIDECASSPCQHDAMCHNELDLYRCSCLPGYTGSNCETGEYSIIFYYRLQTKLREGNVLTAVSLSTGVVCCIFITAFLC